MPIWVLVKAINKSLRTWQPWAKITSVNHEGTCTSGNKKARPKPCPVNVSLVKKLFFLLVALGWSSRAFSPRLRFRLFHRLLGFGGLFGASFRTLFALFVENLLASEQFEESLVRAVALVPCCTDDARVATVPIAEARAHGIEQLHHGLVGHQIASRLSPRRQIAALAERDHLLDQW